METIFPAKLKRGDEIRVIAPARSMKIIGAETRQIANERFKELGLTLSFGKHCEETDDFLSSSVESRLADLHDAFADSNVKAVLTVIGGFNSNQLLPEIGWELIKNNPKIFCGFSDITALGNALFAKTGLVTYSGPHYSSFGMKHHFEYALEQFVAALMRDDPVEIVPSPQWTDDEWYLDQEKRQPIDNDGWQLIQPGAAEGTIIGGNLSTIVLLSGTEYMPTAEDIILFVEDDAESNALHFDRQLTSLTQQPWFKNVRAMVIGRFQKASNVSRDLLGHIVANNKLLRGLPIIADVDFGHTMPIIIFPIGGRAAVKAGPDAAIILLEH